LLSMLLMLNSIKKLGIWVDTKERALPSQGIFDGKYMTTPPWDTADFQASGQVGKRTLYQLMTRAALIRCGSGKTPNALPYHWGILPTNDGS